MARPPLTADQREERDAKQRRQLIDGLATSIGRKGYAATTMADIACEAGVSKTTVYTHFADKEQCFLALFSSVIEVVLAIVENTYDEAARAGLPWRDRVRKMAQVYLKTVAAGGPVTKALLIEAPAVSPTALKQRRAVLDKCVSTFHAIADSIAREYEGVRCGSPDEVLAMIGGINELMLREVELDRLSELTAMTDVVAGMMISSLDKMEPPPSTA